MKTNTYFESMTKTAEAYEATREALKEKKREIKNTYGWDSPEMKAWDAEKEALKDPFTRGEWKALITWTRCEADELLLEDFCWEEETADFIATLRKAGVQSFVTTDQSTGLMENIHGYIGAGCTLEGPTTIEKKTWRGKETLLGLRFRIN